jgi:hypothetical protein
VLTTIGFRCWRTVAFLIKCLSENKERIGNRIKEIENLKKRIENQYKKIRNQKRKIEALEIEFVFANQALKILLPREYVIFAAQILLIKLGHHPQIKCHVRFCRSAYHSTTVIGAHYGAPFVAMVEKQFPDEPVLHLYDEMNMILTLGNNYAHTSPVQEVVSQSKQLVSYMTHSGGKEKLNRCNLLF